MRECTKCGVVMLLFGILAACSYQEGASEQQAVSRNLFKIAGVDERENGCFVWPSGKSSHAQLICPEIRTPDQVMDRQF